MILLMLIITGLSHADNATVKAILRSQYVLILTYHFLQILTYFFVVDDLENI